MTDSNNESQREDNKVATWPDRMKPWLEPARIVFDVVVVVVMVLSLRAAWNSLNAAHNANNLTQKALSSTYVPWPKLVAFSIEPSTNNLFTFNYTFKNFSPTAPAINLKIRSLKPTILNEQATYISDAIMPDEVIKHALTFPSNGNQQTVDAIRSGQLPVRIVISCTDIFGVPYTYEQEWRKMGKLFRSVEYLATGMSTTNRITEEP